MLENDLKRRLRKTDRRLAEDRRKITNYRNPGFFPDRRSGLERRQDILPHMVTQTESKLREH